ncbi:TREHALOSE-PHOSPHATE PHOSPHATASE C-RELATED [Salix purpurea]|uniref:Trehalose 6-phosphate phosphatase n=1 Tax=Salix purpurea TaxID=77065 RepID=A0A9Q0WVM6_SALPP|nr:TREHALOSE-PHOSPHATE PHOSPHATASE C-RELATED [Salix purpurea]
MTNQNVVVPDSRKGIGITIAMALSKSLLSPFVPKLLPAAPDGCFTISRKMFSKKTETEGKTHSWVDSMRDSSPTRAKPTTSLSETQEKNTWIVNHPSALNMFEQIVNGSKGKQIVMFLDYDGTLSPIVEDPDRAFMTNEMREAVRDVGRYFPTAIVTGRCRDKVYSFVRLAGLYYAGSHGMDIKGPSKNSCRNKRNVLFQPASEFLRMIDEVYNVLLERTKCIPGAKVEDNKFCISVHFRCVEEKMWATLVERVRSVLNGYPKLRLTQGRKVLEIRPTIKWDKGKALEFLLESLGYANSTDVLPVYIGDDRTDEDAFKVLRSRGQGLGILVSKVPKETNASYSLQEPTEASTLILLAKGFLFSFRC